MPQSECYSSTPGGWQWPDLEPELRDRHKSKPSSSETPDAQLSPEEEAHPSSQHKENSNQQRKQRHWKPRTCRICLETVLPTFHTPSEHVPGIFQLEPRVTYDSEGGRLLRPCRCKGTSKYVHEECLQMWRHADPRYARRNYYQCPTCNYKYRMGRIGWSRMISSIGAQISLTLMILFTVVFILGFVADPIINFALDPYGSILPSFSFPLFGGGDIYYDNLMPSMPRTRNRNRSGWFEHFTKGFASLGLVSFLKFLLTNPLRLFFRSNGLGGRTTGRDRLDTMTWIMVVVGVATFLWAVWKAVRNWSRRTLEKAGERVMDVPGDDGDDDSDGEAGPPGED